MRSDEAEIRAVVAEYVDGIVGADPERMRRAFHPKACVIGNFQGEMEWSPLEEFIAAVVAEGASSSPPQWKLHSIDVEGDAGSAKLEDTFAGMRFVDYLSLLKTPDGWRIVNKLYHHAG
jgi:hypothetical protein